MDILKKRNKRATPLKAAIVSLVGAIVALPIDFITQWRVAEFAMEKDLLERFSWPNWQTEITAAALAVFCAGIELYATGDCPG